MDNGEEEDGRPALIHESEAFSSSAVKRRFDVKENDPDMVFNNHFEFFVNEITRYFSRREEYIAKIGASIELSIEKKNIGINNEIATTTSTYGFCIKKRMVRRTKVKDLVSFWREHIHSK